MQGVITQQEIDMLNRQLKPGEGAKPQSSRRANPAGPGIVVHNVSSPDRGDTAERKQKAVFFQMDSLDAEVLDSRIVHLRKQNTVDDAVYYQTITPPIVSADTSVLLEH